MQLCLNESCFLGTISCVIQAGIDAFFNKELNLEECSLLLDNFLLLVTEWFKFVNRNTNTAKQLKRSTTNKIQRLMKHICRYATADCKKLTSSLKENGKFNDLLEHCKQYEKVYKMLSTFIQNENAEHMEQYAQFIGLCDKLSLQVRNLHAKYKHLQKTSKSKLPSIQLLSELATTEIEKMTQKKTTRKKRKEIYEERPSVTARKRRKFRRLHSKNEYIDNYLHLEEQEDTFEDLEDFIADDDEVDEITETVESDA